jgi:hypothetical protein
MRASIINFGILDFMGCLFLLQMIRIIATMLTRGPKADIMDAVTVIEIVSANVVLLAFILCMIR